MGSPRDSRDWRKTRSTHADVLESLERVIAAHPSAQLLEGRASVTSIDRDTLAPVVPLRPRLVSVSAPAADGPDSPDAA